MMHRFHSSKLILLFEIRYAEFIRGNDKKKKKKNQFLSRNS